MTIKITWEDVLAMACDNGFLLTPLEAEEWLKKHQENIRQAAMSGIEDYCFFGGLSNDEMPSTATLAFEEHPFYSNAL